MIADALGVTKAAVYHQFRTKDELIAGVAEMELARLEDALTIAESEHDPDVARQALLEQVIDHAVEHRSGAAAMLFDPAIGRVLTEHQPLQRFVERLYGALIGEVTDQSAQVRMAMLAVAIGGTVGHPMVADVDTGVLRQELRGSCATTHRVLIALVRRAVHRAMKDGGGGRIVTLTSASGHSHRSCPATAQVFGATGGYYSRYAMSHTDGSTFGPHPTVEDVASGWDAIGAAVTPRHLSRLGSARMSVRSYAVGGPCRSAARPKQLQPPDSGVA